MLCSSSRDSPYFVPGLPHAVAHSQVKGEDSRKMSDVRDPFMSNGDRLYVVDESDEPEYEEAEFKEAIAVADNAACIHFTDLNEEEFVHCVRVSKKWPMADIEAACPAPSSFLH